MKKSWKISLKTLTVLLSVLMVSNIVIMAQPGPRGQRGPDSTRMVRMIENMEKRLNLTPDQKAKIEQARQNHLNAVKPKVEAFRIEMQKEREKHHAEIRSMLNPQQQVEFDSMINNWKNKGKKGKKGRGACCYSDSTWVDCPMGRKW